MGYAEPLNDLTTQLARLLAPQCVSPQDSRNAALQLERSYQDGLAELERAGYETGGISLFSYLHRLQVLEKSRQK